MAKEREIGQMRLARPNALKLEPAFSTLLDSAFQLMSAIIQRDLQVGQWLGSKTVGTLAHAFLVC